MTPHPLTGDYLPVSGPYQADRTLSMTKRLADMVRERGIERGELSVNLARQVDPQTKVGDRMFIAGAEFVVTAR